MKHLTLFLLAAFFAIPQLMLGASQPNIIFVMPDDVGYGDYACLGNPIIRTPSIDAFKKQSLLFTRFHVSPTCAPTRSALMSGRHEFKNGVTHGSAGASPSRVMNWLDKVDKYMFRGEASPSRYKQCCRSPNSRTNKNNHSKRKYNRTHP